MLCWKGDLLIAQNYIANVKFYNYEDGLAGRFVNCTFKDSRGIIWIGTQFGLSRFDGRDFLTFNDASGLPFNKVMEIYEDSEGWLWLFNSCTGKQGCEKDLAFINSITHEILHFEERFKDQFDFAPSKIVSIIPDENGGIYLSVGNEVILWKDGTIRKRITLPRLKASPILLNTIGQDTLAAWYKENANSDLIYFVFDFNGKVHYTQNILNKGRNSFLLVEKDYKGRTVLAPGHYDSGKPPIFIMNEVGELKENNSIWQNHSNSQNFYFNPFRPIVWENKKPGWQVYSRSMELLCDLGQEFPDLNKELYSRQLRFDEQDIAWLVSRFGFFRIQFKPNPFQRILQEPQSDLESTPKYLCEGVCNLENGDLLLSTHQGLIKYDVKSKQPLLIQKKGSVYFPVSLVKGYKDVFWGINHNKIFQIKKEGQLLDFQINKITGARKFEKSLCHYFENDRLYIGTDNGLHFYDHEQEQFFVVATKDTFEALNQSWVNQIYKETNDIIWLCTSNGLFVFSTKDGVKERYWEGGTGKNQIPGKNFNQIFPAKLGGYWIASKDGLVYWNLKDNESKKYAGGDGLPTTEILNLHEDDFGFLWLTTSAGLIQFQISTGHSKTWLEADGISSKDFMPYSYYCQTDGTVWFGTTNGYTVFHPKDFKDIDFLAKPDVPLNILDFEQFSTKTEKLENRTLQIIESQQITLQPGEQLFNLRVALADYVNGEDAQYAYRIQGVQDFWQEGKENLIRISGLPYGNFNLEIKGKLANGQYSAQEIHLPIEVLKPFYLQTWFYVITGLALFLAFFLWYKWRTGQLKKQKIELERMVKKRTHTIEQQAEELRQLDKVKSRFFANVSHELRTPVTLILGPLTSLLKSKVLNGKNETLAQLSRKNAKNLLKLVNEILDLTSLESGKIKLQEDPVLLFPLVRRLTTTFDGIADMNKIQLELNFHADPEMLVELDIKKFEKLLNNLLSNAFKFTPPKGEITVTVTDKSEYLQLKVSDTGRGIHPNDLPHIFDRFYQTAQPDTPKEGGTGIGLSLCMEFARLMNGKLWAESILGKGSTFYFDLPKKTVDGGRLKVDGVIEQEELVYSNEEVLNDPIILSQPSTVHHPPSTVLLVEDNEDLRSYIQLILSEKYEVIEAENGKIAWDYLNPESTVERSLPDLIISDIMMPVMDGYQLLEKLKANSQFRGIPVIMLTALAQLQDKLKALRIGVDDYMLKPFEEEELLARAANLLRNYQARQLATKEAPSNDPDKFDSPASEWLENLEELLKDNLRNVNFSVDQLPLQLAMSRSQFFRRMKEETGLTPNHYLREMRLQKARQLLETQVYKTIKEVCYAVGFQKAPYFSELFKKRFGKTPSDYLAEV